MAFRSYTFSSKLRFRSVIVVLLDSFRFGTENDLEKRQPSSRPRRKNLRRSGNSPRVRGAGRTGRRKAQCGLYQKIAALLKPESLLLVFCLPRHAVRAPLLGPAETGAGGVRRLLVPILLNGGFGYESIRLYSPVAVDDRVRPLLRSGRCGAACGQRR